MQGDMVNQTPAAVLATLADVGRRIDELCLWSEGEWRLHPRDGGWSAIETLAHMRSVDDIVRPRLLQMIVRDEPLFLDDRRWEKVARYSHWRSSELIEGMVLLREELVRMLERLPAHAWRRTGVHEILGRFTVYSMAAAWSAHEGEHVAQIERAIGAAM
jgi:DinB superfamily